MNAKIDKSYTKEAVCGRMRKKIQIEKNIVIKKVKETIREAIEEVPFCFNKKMFFPIKRSKMQMSDQIHIAEIWLKNHGYDYSEHKKTDFINDDTDDEYEIDDIDENNALLEAFGDDYKKCLDIEILEVYDASIITKEPCCICKEHFKYGEKFRKCRTCTDTVIHTTCFMKMTGHKCPVCRSCQI